MQTYQFLYETNSAVVAVCTDWNKPGDFALRGVLFAGEDIPDLGVANGASIGPPIVALLFGVRSMASFWESVGVSGTLTFSAD